jgi:sugar lactone lactonase YvrE
VSGNVRSDSHTSMQPIDAPTRLTIAVVPSRRLEPSSLRSAVDSAGSAGATLLVVCDSDEQSVLDDVCRESHVDCRSVVADGSWSERAAAALDAVETTHVLFLDDTLVPLAATIEAWSERDRTLGAPWIAYSTWRGEHRDEAVGIGPGTIVDVSLFRAVGGDLQQRRWALQSSGFVGHRSTEIVAASGADESDRDRGRRVADLWSDSLRAAIEPAVGRTHGPHSRRAARHEVTRTTSGVVVSLLTAAVAIVIATGGWIGGRSAALGVLGAIAAALGWSLVRSAIGSVRPRPGARSTSFARLRRGVDHIDDAWRAIVPGTRPREAASRGSGAGALVHRPITTALTLALEIALVTRAWSLLSGGARVDDPLTDVAPLAIGTALLVPHLLTLRVVTHAHPRRTSLRIAIGGVPASIDDESVVLTDLSATGFAADAARTWADGAEVTLRVGDQASPHVELSAIVVRTEDQPGATHVAGRIAALPASARRAFVALWLNAYQAHLLGGSAVEPAPAKLRDVRVGGHRGMRLATAMTMVAVGVAVMPPYPASFADTPPAAAIADTTWWATRIAGVTDNANGPALSTTHGNLAGIARDPGGNLYVADRLRHQVVKLDTSGNASVVAGTRVGFSGDGGPATEARLNLPSDVAWIDGSLYISDNGNNRVRRVAPDGTISTVAGNGGTGVARSRQSALTEPIRAPFGLAVDRSGRLVIARTQQVVRLEANGTVTVLAGVSTTNVTSGDGGPATAAQLQWIRALDIGPDGTILLTDGAAHRVRAIAPDGIITTIAGTGAAGSASTGPLATQSQLNNPTDAVFLPNGAILITDTNNHRIRRVATDGTISTFAGTGTAGYSGDNGPAASAALNAPWGLAVEASGSVVIADVGNARVRRVGTDGVITPILGDRQRSRSTGDGGPASGASLFTPEGVATAADGSILVVEREANRVRRIAPDGTINVVAGTGVAGSTGDGGPATAARLNQPRGIAVAPDGTIYVTERSGHRVRRITTAGVISTVAGTGIAGSTGDGGAATAARLNTPEGIDVAPDGTLLVTERSGHRVRRVSVGGNISTVVGTGTAGGSGDGGAATAARLFGPGDVDVRADGSFIVAELDGNRLRNVSATGTITTIAGTGTGGNAGDGGAATAATAATIISPGGVSIAPDGAIWFTTGWSRVRRIGVDGRISTMVAATSTQSNFNASPTLDAPLIRPYGIEVAADGTIIVSDSALHNVLRVQPPPPGVTSLQVGSSTQSDSTITWTQPASGYPIDGYRVTTTPPVRVEVSGTTATLFELRDGISYRVEVRPLVDRIAGAQATLEFTFDAQAAGGRTAASRGNVVHVAGMPLPDVPVTGADAYLDGPGDVAEDDAGNLYLSAINQIWKITPDGIATVIAGRGGPGAREAGFEGDGGPARNALFNLPRSLAWHEGVLYVADNLNNRIRAIGPDGIVTTFAGNGTGTWVEGADRLAVGLNRPNGIDVDPSGRLVITLGGGARVVRTDADGRAITLAGTGVAGFSGDGGPATAALIDSPVGVAVAPDGRIAFADPNNRRVRMIGTDGTMSTIAGNGTTGPSLPAPPTPATATPLTFPWTVDWAPDGTLVLMDSFVVRRIEVGGNASVIAGSGGGIPMSLPGPALERSTAHLRGVHVRADGSILGLDAEARRLFEIRDGVISEVAGGGEPVYGVGGPAADAYMGSPIDTEVLTDGSLVVTDEYSGRVRRIALDGTVSIVAGSGRFGLETNPTDGALAVDADLPVALGLEADRDGGFYLGAHLWVLHVDADGLITRLAGNGVWSTDPTLGLSGPARNAPTGKVRSIALAPDGSLYFTDTVQHVIKRIAPDGTLSLVAGTGEAGYNGDGIAATNAMLNFPSGLEIDPEGRLWFADRYNHRVRMIDGDGVIRTMAGTGVSGIDADGTLGTSARLHEPLDLVWTPGGMVIAQLSRGVVQLGTDGRLRTIVGNGVNLTQPTADTSGGDPLRTPTGSPVSVAVLPGGSLIWNEWNTKRIRALPVMPAAPTGVASTAPARSEATFGVTLPPAAPLGRGEWLDVTVSPTATASVDGTTVVLSDLTLGTEYTLSVARRDRFSASAAVTTTFTPTSAPTVSDVVVDSLTTNAAALRAAVHPGGLATRVVATVRVEGSAGAPLEQQIDVSADGSARAVTVTWPGLNPGTRYEYSIVATNDDGATSATRGTCVTAPIATTTTTTSTTTTTTSTTAPPTASTTTTDRQTPTPTTFVATTVPDEPGRPSTEPAAATLPLPATGAPNSTSPRTSVNGANPPITTSPTSGASPTTPQNPGSATRLDVPGTSDGDDRGSARTFGSFAVEWQPDTSGAVPVIRGENLPAGALVVIERSRVDDELARATVSADGTVEIALANVDLPAGEHELTISVVDGATITKHTTLVLTMLAESEGTPRVVQVTAVDSGVSTSDGSGWLIPAVIVIALVLFGWGIVLGRRRRVD